MLEIKNLYKNFGGIQAINNISLEIKTEKVGKLRKEKRCVLYDGRKL